MELKLRQEVESSKEYSGRVVDSWKKSETPDNDWF